MKFPQACPICSSPLRDEWQTSRLAVRHCPSCDHRIAYHQGADRIQEDYHAQYPEAEFTQALEVTRRRQARKILNAVSTHETALASWLDFGCGRGWFLEEAQTRGITRLAGADTSSLAVSWLTQKKMTAVPCRIVENIPTPDWPADLFAPQAISFLDVLEHYQYDLLIPGTKKILDHFPNLTWVVVKVPVSSGILYKAAHVLRRLGWERPMEQIYQAGTFPPHWHLFSHQSIRLLLRHLGLEEVQHLDDRDFDGLASRMQFKRPLPRLLQWIMEWGARASAAVLGCDTRITLARRSMKE